MSSAVDTEKVLDSVGGFGWYQMRIICMVGYLVVFCGMVLMVMTFSTAEPPWRCADNSTACSLNGTYKVGDKGYDYRCQLDRSDWEFSVDSDFDSIVTEWDLVCDTAVYVSIANSTVLLFGIIGTIVSSIISDKYGRKVVIYPFAFSSCLCCFISAFSQSYWMFAVLRSLTGIGLGAYALSSYVLVMEYTGIKYRSKVGFGIWYSWILSLMLLALLGYQIPSWRTLSIVVSAPGIFIFLIWWISPESMRWFLVKGKTDEAIKTIQEVARVNKRPFSLENVDLLTKSINNENEKQNLGNIKDLFASKAIVRRTLIAWFSWFSMALLYYGISLGTPTFGGNMYLNFFISAVCEGIGMAIGLYLLDRFGRKNTIVSNAWLAGLAMVVGGVLKFYDTGSTGFLVGQIMSTMVFGKIFLIIAFDGMYVFSSELVPTVVRNTAMGTMRAWGRAGSAVAPFIVYSERVHPLMPFVVMAAGIVVCGILCLMLPETSKTSMPDTVQQVKKTNTENRDCEEQLMSHDKEEIDIDLPKA